MIPLLLQIANTAQKRDLPFLVVGGHAVILLGVPRFTKDLDLLIPDTHLAAWTERLESMGYRQTHLVHAFAQFQHGDPLSYAPIDLMLVDVATWEKLVAASLRKTVAENWEIPIPAPAHIVAMKLQAVSSPHRRPGNSDWSDILDIIKIHHLSLDDETFRSIVIRYGGIAAIERLKKDLSYGR